MIHLKRALTAIIDTQKLIAGDYGTGTNRMDAEAIQAVLDYELWRQAWLAGDACLITGDGQRIETSTHKVKRLRQVRKAIYEEVKA